MFIGTWRRCECSPVPKSQKIIDLSLSPAVILGRERIDAGIDADVANKQIRTLDKMSYLINSSPAETTCASCHRRVPSLPRLRYLAFRTQIRQWLVCQATASGVSVEAIGSPTRAGSAEAKRSQPPQRNPENQKCKYLQYPLSRGPPHVFSTLKGPQPQTGDIAATVLGLSMLCIDH
jgi:hypothetical protein